MFPDSYAWYQLAETLPVTPKGSAEVYCFFREVIGESCIIGDSRWAGTYGVDADFVAQRVCPLKTCL